MVSAERASAGLALAGLTRRQGRPLKSDGSESGEADCPSGSTSRFRSMTKL